MPTTLSPLRRPSILAALAAVALAAVPAVASAACPLPPTTQAFARFGDTSDYFLAPGGGFEGAPSWSRSGPAEQVAGNEPFMLAGADDTTSMRLPPSGRVTTPRFCVTADMPHLRFVARAGGGGRLDVVVRLFDDGKVKETSSESVSPSEHPAWAPSRFVDLETEELEAGERRSADVTFRSEGGWRIDDVLIDPYKRG